MLLNILIVVYVVCAVLLTSFALSSMLLLLVYWRHRHETTPLPVISDYPTVTIQLPIYNEQYVVERLLRSIAALDYPRDRLTVQVLDDSTDETTAIVAALAAELRASGLIIDHVRREQRIGYKAGALAYGTALTDAEFIAVLDADFVLPPGFLKDTVPYLVADPKLGMVQTRWGHLNPFSNLLTFGQMLAMDGHFVVEQTGRNRGGFLMNFNGSGGVWRAAAIRDAGGWQDVTLSEDLDLSYRAQLRGWRFLYLPRVVVPGELPPALGAYKQQQARWAKGSTQCLRLYLPNIWRANLTPMQRIMATVHLCQYLTAPLIILLLLLTPPLLLTHTLNDIPLSPLSIAGLFPPLLYLVSQQALYGDWRRRVVALPVLMALATGMTWNNTRAVFAGLFSQRGEFKRTPKYAAARSKAARTYRLPRDSAVFVEAALALYALWGVFAALDVSPPLVAYMLLYSIAFGTVALVGLRESLAS